MSRGPVDWNDMKQVREINQYQVLLKKKQKKHANMNQFFQITLPTCNASFREGPWQSSPSIAWILCCTTQRIMLNGFRNISWASMSTFRTLLRDSENTAGSANTNTLNTEYSHQNLTNTISHTVKKNNILIHFWLC